MKRGVKRNDLYTVLCTVNLKLKIKMEETRKVNGWSFKYDEDSNLYECRGEVMYDDEHDEMPEPSLWDAGEQLKKELIAEGHKARIEHSEKGWVEVCIN